jgi:hypothetical protein
MQKNSLIGELLNIWIVAHGGREACLIESANFQDTFDENWPILKKFAKDLDLYIRKDPNGLESYPRYLISKDMVKKKFNESELGRMLGFVYLKSDYGNDRVPRTVSHIWATEPEWKDEDVSVWTEVSRTPEESILNTTELVESWNAILKVFPFPLLPNIQFYLQVSKDDGWQMRLDNLNNDLYFIENYEEYLNDVENYTPDEEWVAIMEVFPVTPEDYLIRRQIWLDSMDEEING